MNIRYLALSAAIAMALATVGCGGGGGGNNIQPTPPPTQPPPTDPPPSEPPPDEPPPEEPPPEEPPPSEPPPEEPPPEEPPPEEPPPEEPPPEEPPPVDPPRYMGPRDNLLVPINADLVHQDGNTGAGAKIGLLDDARLDEPHPTLDGRVTFYGDYTSNPGTPDPEGTDKIGHGTVIADSIVGGTNDRFDGGVAPDAELYWGRICFSASCWSDAAGRAADEMVDAGVRIFNMSLGGFYGDDESGARFSSAAWASAMEKAVDAGSLVVVSSGNDGQDTSGFPAAAPMYEPQLLDNWLAVTAVDVDAEGNMTQKSGYANACGDAAQWCLAAPGMILTPEVVGTDYVYGAVGTSMAAGIVSGTAALVQSAYPWMDGDNLQKTLLTTATDLGDPGVDRVFGWGAVNAEKAVRGPGQFITDFNANVTPGVYSFQNDISGDGGLVKSGTGALVLTGDNTFTGDTHINEGALSFTGRTESDVFVNDLGTYASRGGVLGGDYTAYDGATTQVVIGDPLMIEGGANLDGNLHLVNPNDDYTVNSRENILEAGSVSGVFSDTSYASGFFWNATLDYTDTNVYADLVRTSGAASASAAGFSQSVIDGAGQLDAVVGILDNAVIDGNTEGLSVIMSDVAGVMNSSAPMAAHTLSSLTGQIHGTTRTLGVTAALNSSRLHADRMPHLANTDERTFWASGTHIDGDMERDGYANASYRHDELTLGVDLPVNGMVVGASVSHADVRANIAGVRDAMESTATGVTVYGVKEVGDAYVSANLGYTDIDVETRREIVGDSVVGVSSRRDESVWHARMESGYNFDNGLTPFAALGSIRHKQDGFSEQGDTTLGLSAGSNTLNLHYLDLGLRHRFTSNQWTIDSMVAYRNAFDGTNTSFDAWFNGLPEGSFTVAGQPIGKEAVRAMIGVSYDYSNRVSIFGNVGTERVSGQQDNTSAQVGVRVAF